MPTHGSAKSLKTLCLDSIITNIDNVWCAQFIRDMNGKSHWLYVQGPFDCLTPHDCQVLLTRLQQLKILKKHHVYLLIHPGIKTLEFGLEYNVKDYRMPYLMLELAAVRCQGLTALRNPPPLLNYPDLLKRLTSLEMPDKKVTNQHVALVGEVCVNLVKLTIRSGQVTEHGLWSLIRPVNHKGQPDKRYGKCKKLTLVDIENCNVTSDFLAKFYEALYPTIKRFKCNNSVFVAAKLLTESDVFDFRIDTLEWNNESNNCYDQSFIFEPSFAAATSASSSRARAIKLMGLQSLGDPQEFSNVLANGLERLEDLTLVASTSKARAENLCLDYGLIFSVQGSNMSALCLDNMPNIPLAIIVKTCVNLKTLLIITTELDDDPVEPKHFKLSPKWPLEHLQLSVANCVIQPYILREVLTNARKLEDLTLIGTVETFTDDLLYSASLHNSFDRIRKLALMNARNISYEALESVFLKANNHLDSVGLVNCARITHSHQEKYRKYLYDNSFKVILTWA